jgi:hypothetical protein
VEKTSLPPVWLKAASHRMRMDIQGSTASIDANVVPPSVGTVALAALSGSWHSHTSSWLVFNADVMG